MPARRALAGGNDGQAATHRDHSSRSLEGRRVLHASVRAEEGRRDGLGKRARRLSQRRRDQSRAAALQDRGSGGRARPGVRGPSPLRVPGRRRGGGSQRERGGGGDAVGGGGG